MTLIFHQVYMKIFQGDTLPEPKSLMHATAEANNLVALTAAKNLYHQRMDGVSYELYVILTQGCVSFETFKSSWPDIVVDFTSSVVILG